MGATEAEVEVNPIGFEVLKQKHENGKVAEIHKQIFFDLEKDKCIVCDMKSDEYFRLYVKEAKRMAISSQAMMEVSAISADRLSNRLARPYNPKSAPLATTVQCYKCGKEEQVADSHVNGPEYLRKDLSEPECSSCWWERSGSKL